MSGRIGETPRMPERVPIEKKPPLPPDTKTGGLAQRVLRGREQAAGASSPIGSVQPVATTPIVSPAEAAAHSLKRWSDVMEATRHLVIKNLDSEEAYHRFSNVPCPSETAVRATHGDYHYLHANHVGVGISDRSFVASQAPTLSGSFWAFAATEGGGVVDLTTDEDMQKGVYPYYPTEVGQTVRADEEGKVNVKLTAVKDRHFEYEVEVDGEKKTVTRYHYPDWKDFNAGSLKAIDDLVQLLKQEPFRGNNTVIHCRAGIGRTGTLIAAAILEEKINKGEVTADNLEETVKNIVLTLRSQRGSGCVQTEQQYSCIIDYGKWLLAKKPS